MEDHSAELKRLPMCWASKADRADDYRRAQDLIIKGSKIKMTMDNPIESELYRTNVTC